MNEIHQLYKTIEHVVGQIVKGFEVRDKHIQELVHVIQERDKIIVDLTKRVSNLENQKIDDILLKE